MWICDNPLFYLDKIGEMSGWPGWIAEEKFIGGAVVAPSPIFMWSDGE